MSNKMSTNLIQTQAQYATSKGLGGAMVWSIETDDFHGSCHGSPFILIKTIYETLNGPIVYPTPPTGGSTPSGEYTTGASTTKVQTKLFSVSKFIKSPVCVNISIPGLAFNRWNSTTGSNL